MQVKLRPGRAPLGKLRVCSLGRLLSEKNNNCVFKPHLLSEIQHLRIKSGKAPRLGEPGWRRKEVKEVRVFYCRFFGTSSLLTNQHLNLTISGRGGGRGALRRLYRLTLPAGGREVGSAGSDERLRGVGRGPERAFITRLTGGRRTRRATSGRARKRPVAGGRVREAFNSPTACSVPRSSPRPSYLISLSSASQLFRLALVAEFGERGQGPKPSPQIRRFRV